MSTIVMTVLRPLPLPRHISVPPLRHREKILSVTQWTSLDCRVYRAYFTGNNVSFTVLKCYLWSSVHCTLYTVHCTLYITRFSRFLTTQQSTQFTEVFVLGLSDRFITHQSLEVQSAQCISECWTEKCCDLCWKVQSFVLGSTFICAGKCSHLCWLV